MLMLTTSLLKSLTDKEVIDHAIKHGLSFALFRMPGCDEATLYVGGDETADFSKNDDAFVIAPFRNDRVVCIPAEYSRKVDLLTYVSVQTPREITHNRPLPQSYAASVRKIVARLGREGGKTVLATVHDGHCPHSVYDAFMCLANTYSDAFVFCWMLKGGSRVWMGASPELLAELGGGKLRTMALAGTRAAAIGDICPWDKKNIEEQQMVADYIETVMRRHGLEPLSGTPYTKRAGNIAHICTEITAETPANLDLTAFLKDLAPTPAVSGFPRHQALEEIAGCEDFNRGYYAGYCGVKAVGGVRLFVTLRCMSLDPETGDCRLYAGGGITSMSTPESEWLEINAKVATLAGVLSIKPVQRLETDNNN